MKKRILTFILLTAIALTTLTGCSASGSIFENYRDIELLRPIQTLGMDLTDDGATSLSVSVGPGAGPDQKPILMTARGPSITGAISRLQDYSASEDLFYSHIKYAILGEEAAKGAFQHYMDYMERSPYTRLGIAMFVVHEGTAEELIISTGGESYEITSALDSLKRDADNIGLVHAYTCRDIMRRLTRSGSALVCAVDVVDMGEVSSESEGEGKTAIPCGYCVIKDSEAVGYVTGKQCAAVGMLTNEIGALPVELPDGEGGNTTVVLSGCKSGIKPKWENDDLKGFEIELKLKASVAELTHPDSLDPDELAGQLEKTVEEWVKGVLERSQELTADFLSLGVAADKDDHKKFAMLRDRWPDALKDMEFDISVSAEIERSYYLTTSVSKGIGEEE